MMMGAEMVQKLIKFIEPKLSKEETDKKKVKVIIGTVEGDLHDLGEKSCSNNVFCFRALKLLTLDVMFLIPNLLRKLWK